MFGTFVLYVYNIAPEQMFVNIKIEHIFGIYVCFLKENVLELIQIQYNYSVSL